MFRIDARSGRPIYEQIIDQIKEAVLKGYLKQGDAIPSVRRMAKELSVTPNTVAKAYQELERQRIIETIQGKGAFISARELKGPDERKTAEIREKLKVLLIELTYEGYSREEIMKLIAELYDTLQQEG